MGRAFEFRKERKFKRWGHMAKTFTKIGKEITIAVKQGGPDVVGNPRLRALVAEARSENMPKENVERAIKKALEKDQGDFKELVYEGYGPFGIAYLVEAATDNNQRTVANVRSYFTKCGGTLGTSGSVSDGNVTKNVVIYGAYESYGAIQKFIEDNGYELISGGFERIPNVELKEVTPEQRETLDKLTGMLEDDDDVTNVYSTVKPAEE